MTFTRRLILLALIATAICLTACIRFVEREPDYPVYVVDVRSSLAVRAAPSPDADKIAALGRGARVRVLGTDGEWSHVIYSDDGSAGYVSSRYIVAAEPEAAQPEAPQPQPASEPEPVAAAEASAELAGYTFERVVVPAVAYDRVFSLTDNAFDSIARARGSDDRLVVLTYVEECRLVNFMTDGSTMNYIANTHPGELFEIQRSVALSDMDSDRALDLLQHFVAGAIADRESVGWYKRWRTSANAFVNDVFDVAIIRNVLPGSDFLHRYLFGWLFRYPQTFMNYVIERGGSVWRGLALLVAMMLAMHLFAISMQYCAARSGRAGCLALPVNLLNVCFQVFGLFVLLAFTVYMIPSMDNIAVMKLSGEYSAAQIDRMLDFYSSRISVGWPLYLLFIAVVAADSMLKVDLLARSSLPTAVQHRLLQAEFAKINESSFWGAFKASRISGKSRDELMAMDNPYGAIYDEKTTEAAGLKISAVLLACYAIDGKLLVFGIVFFGFFSLRKLASLIELRARYRRQALT